MPTYGYECRKCGHNFDFFQSMKDEPLEICPKCGKEVRRLINGGTGVIFKGNGFYVTDKSGKTTGSSASGDASKAAPAKAESAPCPGCAKSDACPKAVNS